MKQLGATLLKILNKTYPPSTLVEVKFQQHDLAFRTDSEGRPIILFIGRKQESGKIKGERYA